jgi:hypothetical protein
MIHSIQYVPGQTLKVSNTGVTTISGNLVVNNGSITTFPSGTGTFAIGTDHANPTSVAIDGSATGSYLNMKANGTSYAWVGNAGILSGNGGSNFMIAALTGNGIYFDTNGNTSPATSAMFINTSGNVGIGTTSPYATLEVWGPNSAASTTAFSVVNSASTTAFAVYDNGNATYSGSIFQSSDERLKTDVTPLDASSSLAAIEGLTPVSYTRIDQPDTGINLGFIAQAVEQVFPELVSTTTATALTPDGTLTLNYVGLIAPLVNAVQALAIEINGFAQSITTNVLTAVTGDFQTGNFSQQLCIGSTCINQSQLQQLLQESGQSESSVTNDSNPNAFDSFTSSTSTASDTDASNSSTSPISDVSEDTSGTTTDSNPPPDAVSTDTVSPAETSALTASSTSD